MGTSVDVGSQGAHSCPRCAGHSFKRFALPRLMLIHWVLNPGLAFNELVLGQRIPKLLLTCESCQVPLVQRQYVPCPTCGTMNDGMRWAGKSGFGNWLGYVCPQCSARIPCLWNVFSLLVLAVTSPLWYLPYRLVFRDRVVAGPGDPKVVTRGDLRRACVKSGLMFGAVMGLVLPSISRDFTIVFDERMLRVDLPVGVLCGLIFGVAMYAVMVRLAFRTPGSPRDPRSPT